MEYTVKDAILAETARISLCMLHLYDITHQHARLMIYRRFRITLLRPRVRLKCFELHPYFFENHRAERMRFEPFFISRQPHPNELLDRFPIRTDNHARNAGKFKLASQIL